MDGDLAGLGADAALTGYGEYMSGLDKASQLALLKKLMQQFQDVPLPDLQNVAPEQLGPSAHAGVTTDPHLRDAQMGALDEISRVGASGGLTLEDQANLNRILGRSAQQERSGRDRIHAGMAARGGGSSGEDLMLQQMGNQSAAQRSSQEGMDVAGQAQHRALDAMMSGGRLAGDMRGQEFNEKSRAADAADQISRYNADAAWRAKAYNGGLPQQQFQNRMTKLHGVSGAMNGVADQYGSNANDSRQLWGGMGKAAQRAGSAYGRSSAAQPSSGGDWTNYGASDPSEWDNPFGGY